LEQRQDRGAYVASPRPATSAARATAASAAEGAPERSCEGRTEAAKLTERSSWRLRSGEASVVVMMMMIVCSRHVSSLF
jgi:hypothetical protein